MNELLIALLALFVWVWVDALRARESALRACRRTCERFGLQLLDETVALRRLRFARGSDGRMRLRRHYAFEYSEHGNERRRGEAVLLGRHIESVRGDWIEGQAVKASATPPGVSSTQRRMPQPQVPADHPTGIGNDAQPSASDNVVQLSDFRARPTSQHNGQGTH